MDDVLVVGAGVSGLTTALRLIEAGLTVRVIAADPPGATTSAVAGASWGPDLVDDPRGEAWSDISLKMFEQLADDPASGVRIRLGRHAAQCPVQVPGWAGRLPGFRRCGPDDLPAGYVDGYWLSVPLIDMPRYLGYLLDRLVGLGVTPQARTVTSFAEVAGEAGTVVNCTGLASRRLVPDAALTPTRGQLVLVANPGVSTFFIEVDDEGPELTYLFPHADYVVLGGTFGPGDENLTASPATAEAIIRRCAVVEPTLRDAEVLGHRVGLRPSRAAVCLGRGAVDGVPLIHNYGHGGAGITLSWGCADAVLALI